MNGIFMALQLQQQRLLPHFHIIQLLGLFFDGSVASPFRYSLREREASAHLARRRLSH